MGTASLRLHDGTVITAHFDDNADGEVQSDERSRAQNALRAELVKSGHAGSEIDDNASIFILEDGSGPSREANIPAADLARTGAARLFGANPVSGTDTRRAMWAPVATEVWPGGDRHVIYHESNRWDEDSQKIVWGRTVRVDEQGRMFILTQVDQGQNPWRPLDQYKPPSGTSLIPSLRYIPPEEIVSSPPPADKSFHKVDIASGSVTPRTWSPLGVREGYQYYQAPGEYLARRSVAEPKHGEVMVTRGGGANGLEGAVWRAADSADAIPPLPIAPPRPTIDQEIHTRDAGKDIAMRALTGADQFMTGEGVRYEVLQSMGKSPVRYRRPAPEGGPMGDQFQKEDKPDHWVPVTAATPKGSATLHKKKVWE